MDENKKNVNRFSLSGGALTFIFAIVMPYIVIFGIALVVTLIAGNDEKYLEIVNADWFNYVTLALTQATFLCVAYFGGGKRDLFKNINFKKPRNKTDVLVAVLMPFAMVFGLAILNPLFLAFLENFGYQPTELPLPNVASFPGFLIGTVVMCLFPAICEETVFRGVILNSLKGKNKLFAVLFSGFLFSLMHGNPMQTVYQFVVGATLGFVAVQSGTIVLPMIMHFMNNFISVFFEFAGLSEFEPPLFMIIIALAAFVVGVLYFVKHFDKDSGIDFLQKRNEKKPLVAEDGKTVFEENAENESAEFTRLREMLKKQEEVSVKQEKITTTVFYAIGIIVGIIIWISSYVLGL